ncbi:hypothetical protein COK43_21415 [Bacillus cereus]|uniref:hypothetical protein n=1 Tax=Bacillus tropicus TaxID=2026188 RepID=UPI000BF799E3|nr:hypothetical protein [Bacillus tropicus]PFR87879.1 hypothetical protein COK43_21415 [Bacillus cereus]PGX55608.1 hypothetical protein COE12_10060 [Bacillus anthracis]
MVKKHGPDFNCYKEKKKCNSHKEHKCNSQKEHKCCEKETCDSLCECKGVVNNFISATERITVNICTYCKIKGVVCLLKAAA